jgi:adenylylsulfate kinase
MSGLVVWLTGLPASGKSTLAERIQARLASEQRSVVVLDGDRVRAVLGADGYDEHSREQFYAQLGALAGLLAEQGMIVIVAATAGLRRYRERARSQSPRFVEVWVATSIEECAARDPKQLYARAQRGELSALPGVNAPFEPPEHPDVIARAGHDETAVAAISRLV